MGSSYMRRTRCSRDMLVSFTRHKDVSFVNSGDFDLTLRCHRFRKLQDFACLFAISAIYVDRFAGLLLRNPFKRRSVCGSAILASAHLGILQCLRIVDSVMAITGADTV